MRLRRSRTDCRGSASTLNKVYGGFATCVLVFLPHWRPLVSASLLFDNLMVVGNGLQTYRRPDGRRYDKAKPIIESSW